MTEIIKTTVFKNFLFLLFCTTLAPALQAQTANEPYVILTELTLDKEQVDEAIDLLAELQTQTIENEESCQIYDVLMSEDEATQVFIYESYNSEADYKKHIGSSYYKNIFVKKLKPLIKKERKINVFPLNFEGQYEEEV